MQLKHAIILAVSACAATQAAHALTPRFEGSDMQVINDKPDKSTGLDAIFVINDTEGVVMTFTSAQSVTCQRYGTLGGGYAEELTPIRDGNTYTVALTTDDMGYIITEGDRPYYCWIVNYANHPCRFDDLTIAAEQDCGTAQLNFAGVADQIRYYGINGAPYTLNRCITLTYNTLQWNEESEYWQPETVTTEYESLTSTVHPVAPLCDTQFELRGDRFLKQWGIEDSATTETYRALAVEAHTTAVQELRDADNEQKQDGDALGGSAPADITFTAVPTDAAIFKEWQFAPDNEFENIEIRINSDETTYTFREQGTMYVRFMTANADGTCEWYSDTYTVTIGQSALRCPNAFSPGASEGVNDEWKVSYKSIVSFECDIFNRWGVKMCSFTDPSQGWDGKYNGKYVPSGVYYYVIKAVGADGKKYNLSGDINIIKSKTGMTAQPETE